MLSTSFESISMAQLNIPTVSDWQTVVHLPSGIDIPRLAWGQWKLALKKPLQRDLSVNQVLHFAVYGGHSSLECIPKYIFNSVKFLPSVFMNLEKLEVDSKVFPNMCTFDFLYKNACEQNHNFWYFLGTPIWHITLLPLDRFPSSSNSIFLIKFYASISVDNVLKHLTNRQTDMFRLTYFRSMSGMHRINFES